jgi:hypothetical protein
VLNSDDNEQQIGARGKRKKKREKRETMRREKRSGTHVRSVVSSANPSKSQYPVVSPSPSSEGWKRKKAITDAVRTW